jgi:hypothetical protein
MTEENETEDLGTLISEKVTLSGFTTALFEIMFMGMYLFATLAAIHGMTRTEPWISAMLLGLVLVLFERFLRAYNRVMHPLTSYETIQTFEKDGNTITRTW